MMVTSIKCGKWPKEHTRYSLHFYNRDGDINCSWYLIFIFITDFQPLKTSWNSDPKNRCNCSHILCEYTGKGAQTQFSICIFLSEKFWLQCLTVPTISMHIWGLRSYSPLNYHSLCLSMSELPFFSFSPAWQPKLSSLKLSF